MELDLPRFEQGPKMCAATSLQSVMTYFGDSYPAEQIWEKMNSKEIGDLGVAAIDLSYEAELIGFSDYCFARGDANLSQTELLAALKERLPDIQEKKYQLKISSVIRLIEAGGKMTLKIPSRKLVSSYLENKYPVIALVSSNAFYGRDNYPEQRGHYFVISGEESDDYFITDPSKNSDFIDTPEPGKYKINKDHLFFSCISWQGGWLLVIKK